jgi:hypothetical protein
VESSRFSYQRLSRLSELGTQRDDAAVAGRRDRRGVLVDGSEVKTVADIDDYSRSCVLATVVPPALIPRGFGLVASRGVAAYLPGPWDVRS